MAIRTSLNVSLTPELDRFVQSRVTSGRYQTASEVVREGLRLLEVQERERDATFEALKQQLKEASEQADRGEFFTPDQVLEEIEALKRQRAAGKR